MMQMQKPTSWLLDGRLGWRTAHRRNVAADASLRLASDPRGPLALASDDGSLGGVILPRGMAFDHRGRLYLLRLSRPWCHRPQTQVWIKRFDPQTQQFIVLPTVGDQVGSEARQVHRPANIAIAGRNLYVVDYGNRRVQVFDTVTLMLRQLWPSPDKGRQWKPIDVATHGDAAYILDARDGRVYRQASGANDLALLIKSQKIRGRWRRIAVDQEGRIYLLVLSRRGTESVPVPRLIVFDPQGNWLEEKTDSNEIRDRFKAPTLRLFEQDGKELCCLPGSLMGLCEGRDPSTPPAPETPLALCAGGTTAGLLFDRDGEGTAVNWEAPAGPKLYQTEGHWISQELDSKIPRCQWHRIELEINGLPPGTRVEVSTHADDELRNPAEIPDNQWDTSFRLTGPSQPPERTQIALAQEQQESLIQSRDGQYLWVRIKLAGDGYGSPAIRSIRAHFPRETYLSYLPAIYSADEESRRFLERFLAIFQTEWDQLEEQIEDVAALFDPQAVPAGPFLDYLANWLALPLEGTWDSDQRRKLLAAAPNFYRQRGTLEGLRQYLRVYLENITGLSAEEQHDYLQIIEGFRERNRFRLAVAEAATLEHGAPLWSRNVVGRLQLGVFAREGEVRLVSTGDPERDLFHEFAHRFRVFVPAAWLQDKNDEAMLRRAIEAEKPAHTRYDLCLVEPRLRVGMQSTVGVDAVIGGYTVLRLAGGRQEEELSGERPRLGHNTILGGQGAEQRVFQLAADTQVGVNTILN